MGCSADWLNESGAGSREPGRVMIVSGLRRAQVLRAIRNVHALFNASGVKERRQVTRPVNHRDNPDRRRFPLVTCRIRIEAPEAISAVKKLFAIVPDSRRSAETLKALVDFKSDAFGRFRTVLGDVE